MKYLNKFNENSTIDSIRDICNNYLSYLLDQDSNLVLNVSKLINRPNSYILCLSTPSPYNRTFYWVDIKDEFIPFLEIFSKKYKIVTSISFTYQMTNTSNNVIEYSLEDVLNDIMDNKIENYDGIKEQVRLKIIYFHFKKY